MIEILGYIGLTILMVSLSRKSIHTLRAWGIISAVLFLIQAALLESFSLLITNLLIIAIHTNELFVRRNIRT